MPRIKPPTAEELREYEEEWSGHGTRGGDGLGKTGQRERWRRARRWRKMEPGVGGTRGITAPPPADSTYRCQAICRGARAGERCLRWAVRGQRFCDKHGGTFGRRQGRLAIVDPRRN